MSIVISVTLASKKYESYSCLQNAMSVVWNLIKNPNLVFVIGVTKLIFHAILKQKGLIVEGTENGGHMKLLLLSWYIIVELI